MKSIVILCSLLAEAGGGGQTQPATAAPPADAGSSAVIAQDGVAGETSAATAPEPATSEKPPTVAAPAAKTAAKTSGKAKKSAPPADPKSPQSTSDGAPAGMSQGDIDAGLARLNETPPAILAAALDAGSSLAALGAVVAAEAATPPSPPPPVGPKNWRRRGTAVLIERLGPTTIRVEGQPIVFIRYREWPPGQTEVPEVKVVEHHLWASDFEGIAVESGPATPAESAT